MLRFLIYSILLATGLVAAVYAGEDRHWLAIVPSYTLEIILFVAGSTYVIFYFLLKQSRSQNFTQSYLLSMVLKMGGYAAFILVVIFFDRGGAAPNAAFFLVSYVLFTALEVGFLFKSVNR